MKQLLIPTLALMLLGAGCFGGAGTKPVQQDGDFDTESRASDDPVLIEDGFGGKPIGDSPLLTDDQNDVRRLAIEISLLIMEAGNAGIDVTSINAWNDQARAATEALNEEKYDQASRELQLLKEEIRAAIDAQ